jgi:hypothetical protein
MKLDTNVIPQYKIPYITAKPYCLIPTISNINMEDAQNYFHIFTAHSEPCLLVFVRRVQRKCKPVGYTVRKLSHTRAPFVFDRSDTLTYFLYLELHTP